MFRQPLLYDDTYAVVAIHAYRWGRARKMAMIGWEAAQREAV